MSWKLRQGSRNPDTSTLVVILLFFPAIIGLLTATVPTLLIIFLIVFLKIFKKSNVLSNSKYKNDLAKQRKELDELRKGNDDNWWTSGTVLPPKKKEKEIKKGKRGGRYTEDKTKDGRPYRRYF